MVGEAWSGRAYELRAVLGRCAIPHAFCVADSEQGRELLATVGADPNLPIVILPSGHVLTNPRTRSSQRPPAPPSIQGAKDFDLVIVGAGPAGLSAAVYAASEGFNTLVIDEGGLGGQATSSSLIRNYLGFPEGISGGRLAEQAYEQAWLWVRSSPSCSGRSSCGATASDSA